jgi:hypothetical protein
MNKLIKEQLTWLRDEKETEEIIISGIEMDDHFSDADKADAAIASKQRCEMLDSIMQTVVACGYFDEAARMSEMETGRLLEADPCESTITSKTVAVFAVGALIGGAFLMMLLQIFEWIKCPCQ